MKTPATQTPTASISSGAHPWRHMLLALACLCAVAPAVRAVDTSSFDLDSEKEFAPSKLDGVAVDSTGMLVPGVRTARLGIDGATVARALLTTKDGTSYIGTGKKGVVYRLKGNVVSTYAETGTLMATALAEDGRGTLYIGTTPSGQVMRVKADGKLDTLVKLEGAEHIWALAYDTHRQRLYAATGPEGKIFSIDSKGQAEVFFDSDSEHIMCLTVAQDGVLYAGTGDEGLLLEISAPGKAKVLYDFEGNEITAIALRENLLAVISNTFPNRKPANAAAPAKTVVTVTGTPANVTPAAPTATTAQEGSATVLSATPTNAAQTNGKGQLWQVDRQGAARKLYDTNQGHLTAVAWADAEHILAATSKEGQVHRVNLDGTYALWVDVDEKEVLALDLSQKAARLVTGDGAAIYTLADSHHEGGSWISETLDAQFPARFGQLTFRGRGALKLETRSGNTKKPDASWSPWSTPVTKPGPIHSPMGRFLQIRATLSGDSALFALRAFYLPGNQAPIVRSVEVEPLASQKASTDSKSKSVSKSSAPTTLYQVRWTVDNIDGDQLRYRLAYRPEEGAAFRPMLREDVVYTQSTFTWNTDAVPDGYYVVRVEASDELQNDAALAQRASAQSEPVLIDNHPPHITALSQQAAALTGTATDSLGPIASLQYKVDTDPWKPLLSDDGLLDTAEEAFRLPLPKDLDKGTHVIAIRATDMRNNPVTAEWEYTVK